MVVGGGVEWSGVEIDALSRPVGRLDVDKRQENA
jgi:hypothetical protein